MWKDSRWRAGIVLGAAALFASQAAHAVPSFARQMGVQCAACHTVFPELNAFGRQFKARGYTLGNALDEKKFPLNLPLAAGLVPSVNWTDNTTNVEPDMIPRDGKLSLQQAAVYYGGRIAGDFGALAQVNYDGIESKWSVEMVDVRYANSVTLPGDKELLWGVTLNNNPSMADLYNSTPMWGYPHLMTDATVMPNATVLLDNVLFRQIGGLGAYGFWNNTVYGEFALYRTTNSGIMQPLGWGAEKNDIVRNSAPYWRLAVEQTFGPHMFELGTLGLVANVYPDPSDLSTPTNRFTDVGFDAQYTFDAGGPHLVTAHGLWIREKQKWNASFPMGTTSNASDTLTTAKVDFHYYYQRRYGLAVQRFWTWGNEDQLKYNTGEPVTGSVSGSPNSRGWVLELDYLPLEWIKIGLRYTAYDQFNGGKTDYDGFGRNAKDNNATYLYAWLLF